MGPLALLCGLVGVLYGVAALAIGLVALGQLQLLLIHWRLPPPEAPAPVPPEAAPRLLIQLPLYNEAAVVAGLLHSVAALHWPAERLEIQLLDDSDDETPALVRAALADGPLAERRAQGVRIDHLQRADRAGYKAGALRHGLAALGPDAPPFVALFDADFRPEPDFLLRAIGPLLEDPGLGLVQARWAHLNRAASAMTRAQAFHLDAHFSVEQQARCHGRLFMGFNGTAGLWRRRCIDEAGGWAADTLTEDLDLSLRAQLRGWRLLYLDALSSPAELPEALAAIRSQQHRWMKGGSQVAAKLLRAIWHSGQPLATRLQSTLHLCGSSVFVAILTLALVTPLLAPLRHLGPGWFPALIALPGHLLQGVLVVLALFYGTMCARREGGLGPGLKRLLPELPLFLVLSSGLAWHNARAAAQGWFQPAGIFVRTPKGEAQRRRRAPAGRAELALALWTGAGSIGAWALGDPVGGLFLGLQCLGLSWVGLPRRLSP